MESEPKRYSLIRKAGKLVGNANKTISETALYKLISKKFGENWLLNIIIRVDLRKIRKNVDELKAKYPNEPLENLADNLIKKKANYSAAMGFAAGIIPANIPAIILDLMSTVGAQSELIYEIAYLYQIDIEDYSRKGEILTLIALSSGSTKTAEAVFKLTFDLAGKKIASYLTEKLVMYFSIAVGKKLLSKYLVKLIPVAGGIIGATLNNYLIKLTGKLTKEFYKDYLKKGAVYHGKIPENIKNIVNKS